MPQNMNIITANALYIYIKCIFNRICWKNDMQMLEILVSSLATSL
jgi:hypothetical protein